MVSGATVELVHTIRGGTVRRLVVSDAEVERLPAGVGPAFVAIFAWSKLDAAGFDLSREVVSYRDMRSSCTVFEQVVIPSYRPPAPVPPARARFEPRRWAVEIALGVIVAAMLVAVILERWPR